ncbi:hypothetical protein [Candidatus Palauibacter sp.]|uniref:hypothetical protein n=1 Tax=Candidatus Palauibacter sp. TaxID=3101350 RepID=UPI003B58ED72
MKTTLDIDDELLARARRHAANTGQSLRNVIADGLRSVLPSDPPSPDSEEYQLPDLSYGDPSAEYPLPADFGRDSAEEFASRFLEHGLGLSGERIPLSPEGFTRVVEMVEQPPEPTRELRELMEDAGEDAPAD